MKTLLLKMIVCGAALLPFTQVQAAGPASKSFGGFAPGKTFSFKVKTRISKALVGFGTKAKTVAVPGDVPDYKLGQKITFTIGAKGQLTAKDLSLPYKSDGGTAVAYYIKPDSSHPQGDIGQVFKTLTNRPTGAHLLFVRVKVNGTTPTTTTVDYTFE
jgi:hypothetical protein